MKQPIEHLKGAFDTVGMTQEPLTSDPPPAEPTPDQRRLRRRTNSSLGGVASGTADYFGIDPVIIRLAFVVLAVAGAGSGLLLYIAAWILLPDQTDQDPRPVAFTTSVPAIIIGGIVLVAAASAVFGTIRLGFDSAIVIPLVLVAAGFALLNQRPQGAAPNPSVPTGASPGVASPPPPAPTAAPTAFAPPASGPTHWATPVVEPPVPSTPPPPKPPVTSVTLAVGALLVGLLLGASQVTSLDVGPGALFGAFAAACGAGLVASAFIGRARPLIPIGLLALIGLALAPLAETTLGGGVGPREYTVTDEQELLPVYEVGSGYIDLDLRRLDVTTDHDVRVEVGAGYIEITVPADAHVIVDAEARFGSVHVFGEEQSGVSTSLSRTQNRSEGSPTIRIDADATFGVVEVRRG